jgi:hypothetical protein
VKISNLYLLIKMSIFNSSTRGRKVGFIFKVFNQIFYPVAFDATLQQAVLVLQIYDHIALWSACLKAPPFCHRQKKEIIPASRIPTGLRSSIHFKKEIRSLHRSVLCLLEWILQQQASDEPSGVPEQTSGQVTVSHQAHRATTISGA